MRKRGRETCKRYIDRLPLACPQLGTWPATQACALTRNWTFRFLGWCSIHWATPAMAKLHFSESWFSLWQMYTGMLFISEDEVKAFIHPLNIYLAPLLGYFWSQETWNTCTWAIFPVWGSSQLVGGWKSIMPQDIVTRDTQPEWSKCSINSC